MSYIGNSPGVASQRVTTNITATAGQTQFTTLSGYVLGYVDVYLNGSKLINGVDFEAITGTYITLLTAAVVDDVVELVSYVPRGLTDGYTKAEADAKFLDTAGDTATGTVTLPTLNLTNALGTQYGGTGKTSAPAAMANLIGFTTTVTAAGTTTLTNTSSYYQLFTGSTTQTVVLPVTSTLQTGWSFHICNNSTGALTINSSGSFLVISVPAGVTVMCTCIGTTVTTAADWEAGYTDFSTLTGTFGSVVLSGGPALTSPSITNPIATGIMQLNGSADSLSNFHTTQTTGVMTIGGTAGTGSMTVGRSTVSQQTDIQAGATASGSTKTINIGTAGLAGSTTAVQIGSAVSGATSTTTVNGGLALTGTLTAGGGVGTSGQFLQSTSTGVQWTTLIDISRSSTATIAFDESVIRAINTGAATLNQRVDVAMRFQDGTYNGTGGISMIRESATARSSGLSFSSIGSDGNATNAMRLNSSGNLGIGTSSPLSRLDVAVEASLTRRFLVNYDDSVVTIKSSNNNANPEALRIIGDGIRFNTGTTGSGTEAARIDSSGNLVVGNTTAWSRLHATKSVNNTNTAATNITDYQGAAFILHNQDDAGTGNKAGMFFAFAGSPGLLAGMDGYKVSGTWDTGLRWYTNNQTGGNVGTLYERMRIDPSGNVGIGTTSPATFAKLALRSAITATIGTTSTTGVAFSTSDAATSTFYISHNNAAVNLHADSNLCFYGPNAGPNVERMRIDTSGRLLVGTTSNFGGAGQFAIDQAGGGTPIIHLIGTQAVGGGGRSVGLVFTGVTNDTGPAYGNFARIRAGKENATQGNTAGDLVFDTTPAGGALTQRMSISSSGAVSIGGSLSKGSGSFRIEHPLLEKSETHELVHSFIEGPQADLIYRGKVNLVAGTATVNIDTASGMTEGTFEALCRDVQCFTTNESDWTAVRGSVTRNILTIEAQDNTATASISWMVIGERKDKHMYDTEWTDNDGKVIVEPLKVNSEKITPVETEQITL
jgi:hypothetical protein